jgi:small subunit ribosomal protein S6
MNRTYEVMYIVRPDLEEADLEKLIEGFNTVVTSGGGEVTNIEKLGRRRLAYIVRKFQDGIYILLHISADGPLVAELERRLRVTEQIIKFITVRTDEENKRLAKVKALRDSKVKVSAQQQQVVAPAPVEAPAPVAAPVEAPVAAAVEAPAPVAEPEAAPATV